MSTPLNPTTVRFKTFCDTNDELPSTPSITRPGHIPHDLDNTAMTSTNDSRPGSSDGRLRCCCGRPECAYLENNNTILGDIERDLETAAQLGQVRAPSHGSEIRKMRFRCSNVLVLPIWGVAAVRVILWRPWAGAIDCHSISAHHMCTQT
jgi:hypothetical protein